MSSQAKVTFGNNPATSYTLNTNPNFAYQSGENISSSYSPYTLGIDAQKAITANSYSNYEAPRGDTYAANYNTQPYSTSFSSGQVTNPVGVSYESARNVTYASPAAKVTFGGKSMTPTYAPTTSTYQTNYQYTAPAPVQYQTYQTYQQPVQITSQPIRTEVREEVIVEQPIVQAVPEVRRSNVQATVGTTVPETVKETKTKKKEGGCPKWLWPLLGILALLALILGLLFGLGVFGKVGGGGIPTISGSGSTTAAATGGATVSGGATGTTVSGGSVSGGAAGGTSSGTVAGVTSPTGYTVIEETVVLSKDNTTSTTSGVTAPTVTIPTVVTPPVVTPTFNPTITTGGDDDSFAIDPVAVTPVTAATTATYTTTVPTTTTTWPNTGTISGTSANWSGSTGVSGTNSVGTTSPTGTYSGYGSNPVLNGTRANSSTGVDSSLSTGYVDYLLPQSAH